MTMAVLEGVAMCFALLIICVVGIANRPVGMLFFYEKEVQCRCCLYGCDCSCDSGRIHSIIAESGMTRFVSRM